LHETADKNDIINKNESQTKFQFLEQQKLATKIADIYSHEQKKAYIKKGLDMKNEFQKNNIENSFPTIDTIYEKKFVQDFENEKNGINTSFNDYYNTSKKYKKDNNYKPSSPNYSKNNLKNIFYSPISKENKNSQVEEETDEDDEYILVRQPSRHKKKFMGNKTSYRKHIYKKDNCKLKYTLEKYRIKYNIKYEAKSDLSPYTEAQTSLNSNEAIKSNENEIDNDTPLIEKNKRILSDTCLNKNLCNISGYNTNESSTQNNQQEDLEIKKNFKISKKSRFSFVNNYTENIEQKNIFNVPDFVEEILNKKIFLLSFTHLIKGQAQHSLEKYYSEEVLLADEIKIIKNWALEK
jgi:hypothetical protein